MSADQRKSKTTLGEKFLVGAFALSLLSLAIGTTFRQRNPNLYQNRQRQIEPHIEEQQKYLKQTSYLVQSFPK